MPRTYDSPVVTPSETRAQVMAFGVVVVLNASGNPSSDSYFRYVVNKIDADGNVIQSVEQQIPWPSIPTARQAELRVLHGLCLIHAQNNGIIQSGTDADDL